MIMSSVLLRNTALTITTAIGNNNNNNATNQPNKTKQKNKQIKQTKTQKENSKEKQNQHNKQCCKYNHIVNLRLLFCVCLCADPYSKSKILDFHIKY